MFTEAQYRDITITLLDEVFRQSYEASEPPHIATAFSAEIFKVTNTTHSAYIGEVHKGPGIFPVIGETQTIPTYQAKVANKYTIYVNDYSQGIEISKNLFDDDLHGEWQSQVSELALAARASASYYAFGIFRNGFTTTLVPDGSALFATHTLLGGSTQSNQILTADVTGATTSALTTASLQVGQKRMAEMKSQSGIALGCNGDILLVPPALFFTAVQVSQSALVAENGNNGINTLSLMYSITPKQSPYLGAAFGGSDTAWFLLDSKRHAIRRLVRQGIQTGFRDWTYSNNRTYFYQVNYREAYFASDYIGAVGALGEST